MLKYGGKFTKLEIFQKSLLEIFSIAQVLFSNAMNHKNPIKKRNFNHKKSNKKTVISRHTQSVPEITVVTDQPTDQLTSQLTNRPTDMTSFGSVRAHLEINVITSK